MPILTFTIPNQLNVSAQVGDIAYYVPTSTSAQFQINSGDIVGWKESTLKVKGKAILHIPQACNKLLKTYMQHL